MELFIKSWAMWMPPKHNDDTSLFPELKQVPAITRRRLSKLTKLAFDVALQAAEQQCDEPLPTIFASRHGDLHKTLMLLQQLGNGEELSPSQFALSVHNAISGQFSIYSQNQADSNAIAAGADSLHYAVLDAAARFRAEPKLSQQLIVYADEAIPEPYQAFCQDPSTSVALALLLHRTQGQPVHFTLCADNDSEAEPDQAIKLLPFLQQQSQQLTLSGNKRRWQWQRV
ncbi:beta-ketoacyl synthase chain length factor [Rheinheimera aquimaris]|uniref:Beta-ketoacyl synthase chain length factor n=1 Tax=Rheinheimera aquimaris TaxID=412437 RepID=A0ABP3NJW3_9GAMM|nr:beta-ketoacyl synthase chain length factor [Rheinheimera aquimaris]MCB5213016.1 beta-ketoacyl synthase chain length factor [Rheinheimera aquimaris]